MTFADIVVFAIRVYQRTISPALSLVAGPSCGCRYNPTCSQYAIDALREYGVVEGSWLALKRICRCHPWGGCGHDPVPRIQSRAQRLKFRIPSPHGS